MHLFYILHWGKVSMDNEIMPPINLSFSKDLMNLSVTNSDYIFFLHLKKSKSSC